MTLWPLFGSANQLLAALALLAVAMWLIRRGTRVGFILAPFVFMIVVTLTALVLFTLHHFREGHTVLAGLSTFLFCVAIILCIEAWRALGSRSGSGGSETSSVRAG